jgi:hypothetical protein
MALSYTDTDGTLIRPGAAAKWQVAQSAAGTSTTGVLCLVGEAATGADYADTGEDVALSYFGPTQKAAVVAKYGSGRLVDAFCAAVAPSKDAGVRGSPSRIYMIKTNSGTKASVALATAYGTLTAKKEGADGNLIQVNVATAVGGKVTVRVLRSLDNISESWTIGNTTVMSVNAHTATITNLVIGATTITSAGDPPTVAALSITKSQFRTLRDLATYISAQTGWTASVVPAYYQLSPSILDQKTVDCHDAGGALVGLFTKDANEFVSALDSSVLVSVTGTAPVTGLPAVTTIPVYLSAGAKGTSTDANFIAAFAAAERIEANFIVPLVSQDHGSDDDTESASTYTVAGVNAALATHVAKCSQFKYRHPRQGFCSFKGSYVNAKLAAQTMAYARVTMSFLDTLVSGLTGSSWFQPWMGAVVEAAMQAACGYRPVFGKSINISGVRQAAGDFSTDDVDNVEDALLAGLSIIGPRRGGGFEFISDQTTYGVDNNFVLNSIQAIYGADTIAQTVSMKMELAFKGQSFADVTAGVAMSYFKSIMAELKRLKWIVGDDASPSGYRNALIEISAPAMLVSAEIKESTGLYFIPISFTITQTQSTATA